ncbi:IS3 family transposase [Corallococcus exiguus]|uniref:IS3 family transposase n=1 Tax=Corallococcus exiguus TaxID=83462 RepID=UPI0034D2D613
MRSQPTTSSAGSNPLRWTPTKRPLWCPTADERLKVLVREAHELGRRTYGSLRVHRALRNRGVYVSRKRVIHLMEEEQLAGQVRRRYRCTTLSQHGHPANVARMPLSAASVSWTSTAVAAA